MGPWLELSNWAARALAIPGLKATGKYGVKRWWRRRFKRVFGSTAREYSIAYANLEVNLVIRQIAGLGEFPLVKPTRPAMRFKAQKVVSSCELRALSYIGSSLANDGGIAVKVVADEAISDKLDLDFISLEKARSTAVDDTPWRWSSHGASLRADHRNSGAVSLWQADRQLCGTHPFGGLQCR